LEDIPILAEHFIQTFWERHRGHEDSPPPHLSREARKALLMRPWPGNVRELRNVIEHLTVLADPGASIQAEQVPFIEDNYGALDSDFSFRHVVRGADYHTARDRVLAEFEKDYLEYVMSESNGNVSDAARLAGVDRTTLYRLMEKHGTSRKSLLESGAS